MLQKEVRSAVPIVDNKLTPTSLEGIDRMGQYMAASGMYGLKSEDTSWQFRPYNRYECAAIISCGRRFGWDPYAAMEQIALIRNKTCVWGKGVRAAVFGSRMCIAWDEGWVDLGKGGECTEKTEAWVKVKRRDMDQVFEGRFSVADAKRAGLWAPQKKNGGGPTTSPWNTYPSNQLLWRAVGFAVTRGFSDVMMGVGVAEVEMDIPTGGDLAATELQSRLDALSGKAHV